MRVKRCSPRGGMDGELAPTLFSCCRCWRGDGCVPPPVTTCGHAPISRMRCADQDESRAFPVGNRRLGGSGSGTAGPRRRRCGAGRRRKGSGRRHKSRRVAAQDRRCAAGRRVWSRVVSRAWSCFAGSGHPCRPRPLCSGVRKQTSTSVPPCGATGKTITARPILRDGMELAHRCGATPLADRAVEELRAAGGRPRRRAGTGADALTASERRVAELAAAGVSNKEIAQSLFVTLRTVETAPVQCLQQAVRFARATNLPRRLNAEVPVGEKTSVDASVAGSVAGPMGGSHLGSALIGRIAAD